MSDQEIKVALAGIEASLKRLEEKLEELTADTKNLKTAAYNPVDGLYAMIARQDADIGTLRAQLETYSKALWIAGSTIIGLVAKTVVDFI